MNTSKLGTAFAGALLVVGVVGGAGCVADRPSRNGVFNENQYVRKDFLIEGTDPNGVAPGADPGWLMRATVTETSTPNLLGHDFDVFPGASTDISLVRFRVTQDKLQILDTLQLQNPQNPGTTGAPGPTNTTGVTEDILNAWPAENVDLKYQVTLDGEKTNYYQENQELDWQVRQWVKLQFDKNDFSDLAPLGYYVNDLLNQCADVVDASATLVDGSFNIVAGSGNGVGDYMEFTVQVSVPMQFTDQACITAYGQQSLDAAARVGGVGLGGGTTDPRTSVTINLKYSFTRATPQAQIAYKPLVLDEKDPIRTKYGPFTQTVFNRDNQTQLWSANSYVTRFDPTQPIVWYFEQGFPEYYKPVFVGTDGNPGIMQQTNTVLAAAGVKARVQFLNYNDATSYKDGQGPSRNYGDIRYNFFRWVSDLDTQDTFAGVTLDGTDPRTGQVLNANIVFNDAEVKELYVQRIDAFLQTVGASTGLQNGGWPTGACTTGTTQPLVSSTVISSHNATSTLYTKMQGYLGLHGPDPNNDHLGPQDFTATTIDKDADFLNAYFALVPYEVFGDPDANIYVTREGGAGVYGPASLPAIWQALQGETTFQQLTATINSGAEPYQPADGASGVQNAVAFANSMRDATNAHRQMQLYRAYMNPAQDVPGAFSLETVMEQDSQQCVNGQWESQAAWTQHIIDTYWQQVFYHEFGHSLGMSHNFMASVDQPNFTTKRDANGQPLTDPNGNTLYNMYSSSVMEYNSAPARLAWTQGWGNYDKGAIGWIYANDAKQKDDPTKDMTAMTNKSRSGEVVGAAQGQEYPWKDPFGFCAPKDPDCTAGAERQYLRCDDTMIKYSPICRQGDLGATPSEIIANNIDAYEWQYQWRNFRDYRKVWDESDYATVVSNFIVDTRRFLSQWQFDWSPGEIASTLYRIGVVPPANAPSAVDYYQQLTQKFLGEMSKTNQMVAAFHEAIIQQASGERPYATVYDKLYGDVTQQGIILDKYFAMQEFVGLWLSDNYDQNQAGAYISSWGEFDFDDSYESVAETAVSSMIGSQYAVYPYFIPTAVALFAQDTHNPAFLDNGQQGLTSPGDRVETKDWIGGWVFPDETFLINFFRTLAVSSGACASFATCTYDPTQAAQDPQTGAFTGPDGLSYVYSYITSRNEWVVAREDRNIVTWKLLSSFNTDINATKDDGTEGAYSVYEYPIKYTMDAYQAYENGLQTGN